MSTERSVGGDVRYATGSPGQGLLHDDPECPALSVGPEPDVVSSVDTDEWHCCPRCYDGSAPERPQETLDPDDLDTVVIVGSTASSDVYHAPDEDGHPLCGATAAPAQVDNTPDYAQKDPAVLPHHRLCEYCECELLGESPVEKMGNDGGELGPLLDTLCRSGSQQEFAPTLEDDPREYYACPECDTVHDTAAAQQHCLRAHARERADRGRWVA